jgi:reductive dehalogenase
MFGYKRKKRPVEYGPYPMEKLERDQSVIATEASMAPVIPVPMPTGSNMYLATAINKHLDAFKKLRIPEPYSKIAPVPDDLASRSRDIKGSGYFLNASQIGICEIVNSMWLNEPTARHSHAVVVVVEYADPIDEDNTASKWIDGNEHLLATLLAAEIAIDLSGQISSMGFISQVHWTGCSGVDLNKACVLAGLAVRTDSKIINPYAADGFAIAVVTTEYTLEMDIPLHHSATRGKNLSWFLGLSGAVSGVERWRQRRRPSHLGMYPVETLKRVEKLTTEVFADEVPRVPSRTNMYVRTAFGDLSQKAMNEADRWSQKHPVSQGIVRPSWAIKSLQDGEVATKFASNTENAEDNTKALKALSHYMGSAITGVCKVPDYAWYSHDKRGNPIEPYHKYALVVLIDQGYETFLGASGNDWISGSQSMRAYLKGGEIVGVMADMIRRMGYGARAHTNLDSHVLHVPLVLQAGLGEQSRIGESAINPFLGMRFKTAVLTTDMPIYPDMPIDFGVQLFCSKCRKCARECPSQAIPYGNKVIFNGYETWKPDSERCTVYRATNLKGSACGRCVKVCPLSKDMTLDGPILHQIGSWLGINAMWLKSVLAPIAIWLDDIAGNGNPVDEKKWWLDLEVMGKRSFKYDPENYVEAAKGVNRPMINKHKKQRGDDNIAYFPASTLPPPDMMGPYPTDRKLGLKLASEAETVEQGLLRRKNGGKIPETYVPSYQSDKKAQ